MAFLIKISLPKLEEDTYLKQIKSLKNGITLHLESNVTFFVGENGSGKSTLLEGIADQCGFSLTGGNRNHNRNTGQKYNGYESALAKKLTLSWSPRKITEGFFMRAESFFNFATYIDEIAVQDRRILNAYGGRSLLDQSHGESFLSLFNNQFDSGIYLLDEPEAALSPSRILAFMSLINQLEKSGKAQFIIATHSPILIAYPNAKVFQFDEAGITQTNYEDTEHFSLTKSFINNPKQFLHHLMKD